VFWYYKQNPNSCLVTFSGKPIDPKDLGRIEAIVSKQIRDELPVYAKEASLAEAKRIMGLRAVFGEVLHFHIFPGLWTVEIPKPVCLV
jgi:alanyl-tRNA synthetase